MTTKKKGLNPIPSTLRGKKRYVKFKLICGKALQEKEVWNSVSVAFQNLFGASGVAGQRLWLIKWFPESNEGILRCSLREEENVKAGLLFVQRVGTESVVPMIVKVSGSVKKLK